MIPSTIPEIRDALKARIASSASLDDDLETVEWENTFQMVLLLHIYDGLDIIDTRIRTIEQILTSSHATVNACSEEIHHIEQLLASSPALNSHAPNLHTVGQDSKGEGEAPVP